MLAAPPVGGRGGRRGPHCGRTIPMRWPPNPPHRPGQLPLHDLLSKICDKTGYRLVSGVRGWWAAVAQRPGALLQSTGGG